MTLSANLFSDFIIADILEYDDAAAILGAKMAHTSINLDKLGLENSEMDIAYGFNLIRNVDGPRDEKAITNSLHPFGKMDLEFQIGDNRIELPTSVRSDIPVEDLDSIISTLDTKLTFFFENNGELGVAYAVNTHGFEYPVIHAIVPVNERLNIGAAYGTGSPHTQIATLPGFNLAFQYGGLVKSLSANVNLEQLSVAANITAIPSATILNASATLEEDVKVGSVTIPAETSVSYTSQTGDTFTPPYGQGQQTDSLYELTIPIKDIELTGAVSTTNGEIKSVGVAVDIPSGL